MIKENVFIFAKTKKYVVSEGHKSSTEEDTTVEQLIFINEERR